MGVRGLRLLTVFPCVCPRMDFTSQRGMGLLGAVGQTLGSMQPLSSSGVFQLGMLYGCVLRGTKPGLLVTPKGRPLRPGLPKPSNSRPTALPVGRRRWCTAS